MKWLYRIERVKDLSALSTEQAAEQTNKVLAQLGEDGWEFVSVIPIKCCDGATGGLITEDVMVFKHPKE